MLRFAILTHDHPYLHWDLLLEQAGQDSLLTWRLEKSPALGEVILAEELPGHRRIYLDYEGPVSGNRGKVRRWDAGEYERLSQMQARIEIAFLGQRVRGKATLTRLENGKWAFEMPVGSPGNDAEPED